MNKRTIITGLAYSIFVIIYKLIIILGGYQFTKFGFYYSHVLSVFLILPFVIYAIKGARDKDMGGKMTGKEAFKTGAGVVAIAAIILSIYNYVEFEWKLRDMSLEYYNSPAYIEFLKGIPKLKPEDYPKVIAEVTSQLSGFKAVTAKLLSFFILGLGTSFIGSVFMKKD